MTETYLIEACIQDNPVAQRELYNQFSSLLFGICYRYAANREDAEDILQDSFVKIFTRIKTYENKGNFEGWLKRVVVNTCINYLKKNEKFSDHIELDHIHHIGVKEESIASKLLGKQVIECLRMLPVGYRTVINLYAIEGFSHKEIADMLEVEESTSRTQYLRGKEALEFILQRKKIINTTDGKLQWLALLNS